MQELLCMYNFVRNSQWAYSALDLPSVILDLNLVHWRWNPISCNLCSPGLWSHAFFGEVLQKKVWKFEWKVMILKPFTLKCMCTLQTWTLALMYAYVQQVPLGSKSHFYLWEKMKKKKKRSLNRGFTCTRILMLEKLTWLVSGNPSQQCRRTRV